MSDDYVPEHRDERAPVEAPLSDTAYDRLKQIAQIWLPALAVFYISIGSLWGLPKQEEVAGTIMALDLLLGAVLMGLSRLHNKSDSRFDGELRVVPDEDEGVTNINFSLNPLAVEHKDEVLIKVNRIF